MSIADVRRNLTQCGLRINDCFLTYTDKGKQIIHAIGFYPTGVPFNAKTEPFAGDPIARAALFATELTQRHTGVRMGKFETVATRMHALKAKLEGRADELLSKIDATESRGHAAFDKHEEYLTATEGDLAEMEKAISQLSNGGPPLGNS